MRLLDRCRFLALLGLILVLGCSSDDTPTGPGDGGGGTAGVNQFGAQIEAVHSQYIAANAEAYASLDALGPYIAAALASPSPLEAPRATAQALTCFSGVAGTTYIFDGTAYVAGPAMGAPDNAVRYVLYGLDGSNQPVLTDSIGYLEVACSIVNQSTKSVGLTIVANGVAAVSVNGTVTENIAGVNYNTNGYLAAAGVSPLSIGFSGQLSLEVVSQLTLLQRSDFQVDFGSVDSLTVGKRTNSASALYFLEPYWGVLIRLHADASTEAITSGALYYGDLDTGGVQQLVACVSGGTLAQPTYSAPSQSCNEFGYEVGPAFSSADLATVSAAYQRLRSLHEFYAELALAAFGIPTGA